MKFCTLYLWLGASAFLVSEHLVSASCKTYTLDFDHSGLTKGQYITDELVDDYHVSIYTALRPGKSGFIPNNAARIFDTSDPGTNDNNGDPDLGSPNENCPNPGPGIGEGGAPGTPGENCVGVGNVLIIQETDKIYPDDNKYGGTITFTFTRPATMKYVQILDVDDASAGVPKPKITLYFIDGTTKVFEAKELGNNSIQIIQTPGEEVTKVDVFFWGSGSVAALQYEICSAGGGGDPHFITFDGTDYEYHGECDLVMARTPSFGNNLGLDLHIRTQIEDNWSFISNAALRIGDDIFEYGVDGKHYLNGHTGLEFPIFMAENYKVTKHVDKWDKTNKDGEAEKVANSVVTIHLGNQETIKMSVVRGIMYVRVNAYLAGSEGMLGIHGVHGMVGRNHEPVLDATTMGDHWQVRDTEPMLFHEIRFPQHPMACTPPPTFSRRRLKGLKAKAQKACAGLPEHSRGFCIDDVLQTGDLNMAENYSSEEEMI